MNIKKLFLIRLLKNFLQKQTYINSDFNNKIEKRIASLIVIAMLSISQFAFSQNALLATGGTGTYKNDIYWLNFSGVTNLGPGGITSLSRDFTVNGVAITVTIDQITFSGELSGGRPLSDARIVAYRSGSFSGDGLDDVYNIGGVGTNNTLVNAFSTNFNGNFSSGGTGLSLTSNFRIRAYATLSGQPIDLGLVFASAEDDAVGGGEYSQASTNGSPWNLLEGIIQSPNGQRLINFSSGNTVARMVMGRSGTTANVAVMYTQLGSTSVSNQLTSNVQFVSAGKTAIALGIFFAKDFGDSPTSFGSASNTFSPDVTGGTNNPPAAGGNVYLSSGTNGGTPVITAGTLADPQDLRIGNIGGDRAEPTYPVAGNGTDDDGNGVDDEDGINTNIIILTSQTSHTVNIPVFKNFVTAATPAYVMAWIDYNRNGIFEPNEYTTASFTTNNSLISLPLIWNLSSVTRVPGNTYARLRITTTNPSTLTDNTATPEDERSFIALANGETEDHQSLIVIGPPTANNDAVSGNVGSPVTVPSLIANDVKDPNGAALSPDGVSLITPSGATGVTIDAQGDITGFTVPSQGTWSYNSTTGALTFTPQSGYTGSPTPINYTVKSPEGLVSNQASASITYFDPCLITASNPDSDGDGISNFCDQDDDNDGILDIDECNLFSTTNAGFEIPDITQAPYNSTTFKLIDQSATNGWKTTATDGIIELWRSGFNGVPAAEGNQFAELNANQVSTLYQNFTLSGSAGIIYWSVKHRGRSGTDVANIKIGSSLSNLTSISTMTDGNSAWGTYTGTYLVTAGQTQLTIAFESVSAAGGSLSVGNFLDDVKFTFYESCDLDGDTIPNSLDSDSDNDGCPDAIEGDENVVAAQLNTNGSINITANGGINANGVPNLVNMGAAADIGGDIGQGVGGSQDALVNTCFCYETPTNLTASVPVKHGITVLGRAGSDNGNWPMLRNSAYTALEGKTKGFVITRNSSPETTITNPVVGMMVFDTNEGATGCLKIYTGSGAGEGWKCFNNQTCP